MMGTPWETWETVEETISFAKELRASKTTFFIATPYPGTELREEFIRARWRLPESYTDYRHWPSEFTARRGEDPSTNPREFFATECRRAAQEIFFSQLRDFWHYPEIMRAYLRMHTLGELCVLVPRELRRILRKPRGRNLEI